MLSGETDLRAWPAVSIAGPQQSDQVEAEKSAQQCQHHIVVSHGGKQLCCARYIHVVRHHKEGAPKESEVVTQTLYSLWSAFLPHLRRGQQVTVWYEAINIRYSTLKAIQPSLSDFIQANTHLAAVSAPCLLLYVPVQALGHKRTDLQCQVSLPNGIEESGVNIPDSGSLL